MGVIPLVSVTAFWLVIGAGGPFLVRRGPNQGTIRIMIIMTAVCCWLMWIMIYLHQLNPLIGPQINVRTALWISEKWGDSNNSIPEQ